MTYETGDNKLFHSSSSLIFLQTKRDNVANEEQEMEFSVTEDISDKLANPEETSKAKKKRKAHEKLVIWVVYLE